MSPPMRSMMIYLFFLSIRHLPSSISHFFDQISNFFFSILWEVIFLIFSFFFLNPLRSDLSHFLVVSSIYLFWISHLSLSFDLIWTIVNDLISNVKSILLSQPHFPSVRFQFIHVVILTITIDEKKTT